MASAYTWTPDRDQIIRDGYANGTPVRQLAKTLGCGIGTVSKRAKTLGVSSHGRDQVAKAVEAKTLDAKARKAEALLNELTILELNQASVLAVLRGEQTWRTILKAPMGAEEATDLDFIPSRDLRETTNARSGSAAIIAKLEAETANHNEGKSVLRNLMDGLRGAYQQDQENG